MTKSVLCKSYLEMIQKDVHHPTENAVQHIKEIKLNTLNIA